MAPRTLDVKFAQAGRVGAGLTGMAWRHVRPGSIGSRSVHHLRVDRQVHRVAHVRQGSMHSAPADHAHVSRVAETARGACWPFVVGRGLWVSSWLYTYTS